MNPSTSTSSDAGRFGFARLVAAEQGVEAFGYVVPSRDVFAALDGVIGTLVVLVHGRR